MTMALPGEISGRAPQGEGILCPLYPTAQRDRNHALDRQVEVTDLSPAPPIFSWNPHSSSDRFPGGRSSGSRNTSLLRTPPALSSVQSSRPCDCETSTSGGSS